MEFTQLESVLGIDGRWKDVWSRYCRGTVSPPPDRVRRVERKLPGTAIFFTSEFWTLLQAENLTWAVLHRCRAALPETLRRLAPGAEPGVFGGFDLTQADESTFARQIFSSLHTPHGGMDALAATLYWLRQAQARRDALGTLKGFQMVAAVADMKDGNESLQTLPRVIFEDAIEPLREMRFSPPWIESVWTDHRDRYRHNVGCSKNSLDLIGCLLRLYL